MKKFLIIIITAIIAMVNLSARNSYELRRWDFRLDVDKEWKSLTIPHDFQMELPWDKNADAQGFKSSATAWYRMSLKADESWKGQKVLLDFEGIGMNGEVWFNGEAIGEIDYGYLGAEMDITKLVKYDADNEILVKAYTGNPRGSRWYTGGGLYRPVHLVIKNPVSVGRHGVFITTPTISEESAEVKTIVEIEGFRGKDEELLIVAEIFDPEGKSVAKITKEAPRRNNLSVFEVEMPLATIKKPMLWDCENPWLYNASISLIKDGKVIDSVDETFGIRSIEFDNEYGFKLNGKKVFLKGISNHHDLGALGSAAYEGSIELLMTKLKEFGFNHIRCSHNPYSESFYDLADKHGILVVDELYDKWMTHDEHYWIGKYPFAHTWFNHMREWIKRDRNHPSVIMWSLANETQVNEGWLGFPGTADWGETTFRVMKVFGQRFDSTRPYTVGQYPSRKGSIHKGDNRYRVPEFIQAPDLACVTDVASLNYMYRDYQSYLKYDPELNIYQSEATTNELTAPFFGMDQDKMVGLAYWGAVEYWGESNGWPKKGWNYSFFNSAMEPYPQAYLIKSAFIDEPLVRIGVIEGTKDAIEWNDISSGKLPLSENWNLEKGSLRQIFTFTNADEVELFVNGRSQGVQKNDRSDIDKRNIIIWNNVPYGNGGKIEAVAKNAGKVVARHSLETAGKAVSLDCVKLSPVGELEYIKVYTVDRKGRRVLTSDAEILFEIEGDAEIVAIDDQDHYTNELFNVNPKKAHNGFVMAIIRKGSQPSTLKISSKGLKTSYVELGADKMKMSCDLTATTHSNHIINNTKTNNQ